MCKDKVFAAGFADQTRIGVVFCNVLANQRPYAAEDCGGTGEVETGHASVGQQVFADIRAAAWNEVDDAIRQSGLFEQLHEVVVGQSSGLCRFPDNGVAHDGRSGAEVAADRGKVKWGDRYDKAIQRTVFGAVPYAVGILRLLAVNLLSKCDIVAQEVCQLTGRVDLCLESSLALAQHGGCIHLCAPWTGQQIGSFEEDGGSVLPWHIGPLFFGGHCSVSGSLQLCFTGDAVLGQHMVKVVRHDAFAFIVGVVLLTGDDDRNFYLQLGLAIQLLFKCLTLRAARQIGFDGLIIGFWNCEICVAHNSDVLSR